MDWRSRAACLQEDPELFSPSVLLAQHWHKWNAQNLYAKIAQWRKHA